MRTVIHISDLHFGRADKAVLEDLHAAILAAKPDVVVVSGDLTQRARAEQFAEARHFLDTLPRPQIVVPGNHDVPLYNVAARWLSPLGNYKRHMGRDLEPFYADGEIAILGLNTARSLTLKNGRINRGQAGRACARFTALPESIVRIVVTHHPFSLPVGHTKHSIVGRAAMAMTAFAQCKVDIILSGHLHASHAITSETVYAGSDHRALLVQAGTASSARRRHEPNAFNILRVEGRQAIIERLGWKAGSGFAEIAKETFRRGPGGWSNAAGTRQ
jgi:3',5'-cyclic AMP phosphodiesterase CpdA